MISFWYNEIISYFLFLGHFGQRRLVAWRTCHVDYPSLMLQTNQNAKTGQETSPPVSPSLSPRRATTEMREPALIVIQPKSRLSILLLLSTTRLAERPLPGTHSKSVYFLLLPPLPRCKRIQHPSGCGLFVCLFYNLFIFGW